jgi:hypothetical protein
MQALQLQLLPHFVPEPKIYDHESMRDFMHEKSIINNIQLL